MADDHIQRPYRGNETSARGASGGASGNDPLAELARLIGQNDPFSEFGRDGGRRAPAAPAAPAQNNLPPPSASPGPLYGSPDFARQPYGGTPLSVGADLYHVDNQTPGQHAPGHQVPEYEVPTYEVPGYGAPGYDASGFPVSAADAAYEQDTFPPAAQHRGMDDDYYDDVPPNRRRIGILAIAGVFALAVIGTAGAFGYRAIFGSSSVSGPPPVIKAESAPSKIVPAATSNTQANKTTERVGSGQGERLVSREEQPVAVTTTGNVFPPQGQNAATLPGIGPQLGSGVVGSDPKRIRTIVIKPDQSGDAMQPAQAEPAVPAPAPQPRVVATPPRPVPAPTPAPVPVRSNNPPQSIAEAVAEPEPAPRAPAPRAAPPVRAEAPAAPSANAPLSLNPNAAPARAAAPAPQRTAAAAAPIAAASGGAGGYAVQVSAQRSEEEAQAAFRSLQGKFPGQLGNRQPVIKRVDLGDKGVFYRAMVGPFGDSAQASALCTSLKAAGGTCLIQKN